ncbi:TPA: branched-chain amino acid ABC transporter permease [Candidatus Bathyarchaeota archaeon]|nr:branched-chain amino acid ABC transporter permease [Candidatus Bathyarchaeota archaeon]
MAFPPLKSRQLQVIILPMALLLALPFLIPSYYVTIMAYALTLALIALGVNFLLAHGEMPSFGHAAFYALSGYTAAIAFSWYGIPAWLSFILGVLVAMAVGFGIAPIFVRRRGIYFAILTLVFGEVIHRVFWYTKAVGGSDGMSLPVWFDRVSGYYIILFLLFIGCLLFYTISNTPFGRALKAIGENELRAAFIGYNISLYKMMAFALSGIFPALAGAFRMGYDGFICPEFASVHISAEAVVVSFLGGIGSILGTIIFSVFITLLLHILASYWLGYAMVIGIMVILVVLFIPGGVIPLLRIRLARKSGGRG